MMRNDLILLEPVGSQNATGDNQLFRLSVVLTVLFFLNGCASLQEKTSVDLKRQIERQQVEQEIIAKPVLQEERTIAEFEELGDRYLSRGDMNRAYIYYTKGLGLDPDNVSMIHKQGTLLLKKNKFVEAEAVYEKLLVINNSDSLALEGRGKAYFGQGKIAKAEQDFVLTLEKMPERWQSHEFLALILSQRHEYDQAIDRFKTALKYQPRKVSINNNLAVSYHLNGNSEEAVRLLQGLVKTSGDRKIYNNLAVAYFQLGAYEEAIDAFKRGSEHEAVAYNNMGYAYLIHEKYRESIQAFEKAIRLHPKYYPSAQKNLNIAKHKLSEIVASTVPSP